MLILPAKPFASQVGVNSSLGRPDLLVGGLDDWAYAGWVLQSARLAGETDPAGLRDLTVALIFEVLREGLMVAGDVVGDKHFPWHGRPEEWGIRIREEWQAEWGDEVPSPGAIVWLANTPVGDAVARAVLAREADQ
jgi:hypothetical protein